MSIAALVLWLVTAGGGFYLLAKWVARGGVRQAGVTRLSPPLVFGHFLLAALGLVVWIAYLVLDNDTLGWVALGVLVAVALLGFTMFFRWLPTYRSRTQLIEAVPAERSFPIPVVLAHGALAATTIVVVLLANLGVGGS
ncbi:MAG: hypothetical protein J2P40_10970 [Candidatus Dormibacteraeota bacterium]|nr:hypothetical protein [Candidatus Dormibacteraeota bacterium]MBO0704217.1 hypothetical protein [Candidatus Dormibacteraeota bacterium]MBO0761785.1 hypothetical protein [Candidatus Dormibacteraeota bacterium]